MGATYLGNKLVNAFFDRDSVSPFIETKPFQLDWLMLGGGGSGGASGGDYGGGGGAGRFVSSSFTFTLGETIGVVIGAGGASVICTTIGGCPPGNNGGQTNITYLGTTYTAPGGGGGGATNDVDERNGFPGGSGGGGASAGGFYFTNGGTQIAGNPIAGFGNNGLGKALGETNSGANSGGAGNVSGPREWLDGIYYGGGAVGGFDSLTPAQSGIFPGDGGAGANWRAGFDSQASGAGAAGIAKFRYLGSPKLTGGTITQSGGYTYHTFTSNGTLE